MTWEPISTAPKDGTPILICNIEGEYVPQAAWWCTYHPNATGKACWRTSSLCGNKIQALTHWMPLPEAPPR